MSHDSSLVTSNEWAGGQQRAEIAGCVQSREFARRGQRVGKQRVGPSRRRRGGGRRPLRLCTCTLYVR